MACCDEGKMKSLQNNTKTNTNITEKKKLLMYFEISQNVAITKANSLNSTIA